MDKNGRTMAIMDRQSWTGNLVTEACEFFGSDAGILGYLRLILGMAWVGGAFVPQAKGPAVLRCV